MTGMMIYNFAGARLRKSILFNSFDVKVGQG